MVKNNMVFAVLYMIWCIPLWFVAKWMIWLDITLNPHTRVDALLTTWVIHGLFLTLVPTITTLATLNIKFKRKKQG